MIRCRESRPRTFGASHALQHTRASMATTRQDQSTLGTSPSAGTAAAASGTGTAAKGAAARSTVGGKTLPNMLSAKREKAIQEEEAQKKSADKKQPREKKTQPRMEKKRTHKKASQGVEKTIEKKQGKQASKRKSSKLYDNLTHPNVRKLVRKLDPRDEQAIAVLIKCYDILNYKFEERGRQRMVRYAETFRTIEPKAPPAKPVAKAVAKAPIASPVKKAASKGEPILASEESKALALKIHKIMEAVSRETLQELLQRDESDEGSSTPESDSEMEEHDGPKHGHTNGYHDTMDQAHKSLAQDPALLELQIEEVELGQEQEPELEQEEQLELEQSQNDELGSESVC